MTVRLLITFTYVALLVGCSSAKKQAEMLEQTKPLWLKERPVNAAYYYGIGIVSKVGAPALYEDKAKERALADIAGQINSTVKSEAILYQVEDKNGVRDYLQNRIKSISSEYLEGYEYIEKWEDLSNVYVYYRLSKQKFLNIKEARKKEAFKLASEKYLAGKLLIGQGNHVGAIEHFAIAIDALSGYLNESTTTDVDGKQMDLVSESINEISGIIKKLQILSEDNRTMNSDVKSKKEVFVVYDPDKGGVFNMPVKFTFSGGYLVNDRVKSGEKGSVVSPELIEGSATPQTLRVEVDLENLARQVTRNLYVRKIIENQKAAVLTVKI
jgi:hypothetical protein